MGTLYIVSTPIGNLDDITLRAINILQTVDAIACEDTRKTGGLLKLLSQRLGIESDPNKRPRLISYYEQNEFQRIPEILNALKNGLSIALVSDAGTPLISDPGFKLVQECLKEDIRIVAVPGASSVLSAIVSSGLPTDKFLFLGYLPKKPGHRKQQLEALKQSLSVSEKMEPTVILFEAPHRLMQLLDELEQIFGDIHIVLCREITKIHEEIRRELVSSAKEHFSKINPKGEFVILFNLK